MNLLRQTVCFLAGLLGAAGVGAAALAAHGGYGETLRTASDFALVHAVLVLILCLRPAAPLLAILAGLTTLTGALLFCGDLALRALANHPLFPMAAPAGGMLLIAGWILSGLVSFQKTR